MSLRRKEDGVVVHGRLWEITYQRGPIGREQATVVVLAPELSTASEAIESFHASSGYAQEDAQAVGLRLLRELSGVVRVKGQGCPGEPRRD